MFNYAQLDGNGVCICISQLSDIVDGENMISLDSYDVNILGKLYNNGNWIATASESMTRLQSVNTDTGGSIVQAIGKQTPLPPIDITGTHCGDEPPKDTSKLWFKPINL